MKPSERIRALGNHALESYQLERCDPTARTAITATVMGAAILDFLDEQAEIEQRRTHVRNALAMLGAYYGAPRNCNEQLEAAGLQKRVGDGEPLAIAASDIIREAKREGLF